MKLFKRGLLVAALSVSALAAMTGMASGAHLDVDGSYVASGTLTLSHGLGSTCSFTTSGTSGSIDDDSHAGTVASFDSSSCTLFGSISSITDGGTWNMSIGAGDVVTIVAVSGTMTWLGTSCGFAAPAGGLKAQWSNGTTGDGRATLTFDSSNGANSSQFVITNTCAFGLAPSGLLVGLNGVLTVVEVP